MGATVQVRPGLAARLAAAAKAASQDGRPAVGWLFGLVDESDITVISAVQRTEFLQSRDGRRPLDVEAEEVRMLVPPGLRLVGAYAAASEESPAKLAALARQLGELLPPHLCDLDVNEGILTAMVASAGEVHYALHTGTRGGAPKLISPAVAEEAGDFTAWLDARCVLVRCAMPLQLRLYGMKTEGAAAPKSRSRETKRETALKTAVAHAEAELQHPDLMFLSEPRGARAPSLINDETSSGDVTRLGNSATEAAMLRPLHRQAGGRDEEPAPYFAWQPVAGVSVPLQAVDLQLDVLCYAPRNTPLAEFVAEYLRPALLNQLQVAAAQLGAAKQLGPLRALHFRPSGWPHAVTAVLPLPPTASAAAEDALQGRRLQLHRRLTLPLDRPMLRVANALSRPPADGEAGPSGSGGGGGGGVGTRRLTDVHVGLPPSKVVGGTVHLVDSSYEYYHYLQDKMDDKGWGCAYRSLQTIWSWFRLQGYTDRPVPDHRTIQQTLVDIGDKEAAFVGSSQWIGALELSFVLDTLLGVTCRVLDVAAGSDLPSKARELAHHFDTQGTPVMIGGGVLAYTLLGVDFNESTGQCAFLILDPHYTGADDLKRVQSGSWVAWKQPGDKAAAGGDLFVAKAHYNLLRPQRPSSV